VTDYSCLDFWSLLRYWLSRFSLVLCLGGGFHDCFDHQEDQGPIHYSQGQGPDKTPVAERSCTPSEYAFASVTDPFISYYASSAVYFVDIVLIFHAVMIYIYIYTYCVLATYDILPRPPIVMAPNTLMPCLGVVSSICFCCCFFLAGNQSTQWWDELWYY
jgi:hypothetical protein